MYNCTIDVRVSEAMQCVHAIARLLVGKRPLAKSYSSYMSIKRPDLNIYRDKCLPIILILTKVDYFIAPARPDNYA